jgi:hypothetical protein
VLRAHRSSVWTGEEESAPPPSGGAAEHLQILGTDPPTPHTVGPFFAGWEADYWTQSTADLHAGTMQARYALGHVTYEIEDAGTQRGPAGALRFEAQREGSRMTGAVIAVIWWQDDDTGEVDGPAEEFRFPFQAVQWGAPPP